VLLRTAEAHLSRGQRGDAARTIAQARAVAVSLGASWLVDELDSLAARARLAPAEPGEGADGTGRDEETELPFGLTRRELEVLALVSRGATNREIGQRLFMAEKTASVHVSRILAKLDVRSRTEAAAVAHRAGLGAAPQPLAARRGHPGTGA
jgi:DNA-binding NarL/FixJ family response regulator